MNFVYIKLFFSRVIILLWVQHSLQAHDTFTLKLAQALAALYGTICSSNFTKKSYLNNFELPSGFFSKLVVYIVVKNSFAVKLHADWDSLKGFPVHWRKSSGCLLKEEYLTLNPSSVTCLGWSNKKMNLHINCDARKWYGIVKVLKSRAVSLIIYISPSGEAAKTT